MTLLRRTTPLLAALFACAGLISAPASAASFNPSTTSVQLFKWSWTNIAKECTDWLGPQGYGAVQISPPAASKKANGWWDMYQPVNYGTLTSRMGNESELQTMIDTCHAAGVRVYADVVVNQLADQSSAANGVATDGSSWDSSTLTYPQFSSSDFHSYPTNCSNSDNLIHDGSNGTTSDYSTNRSNVVNCRMGGLPDLKTESSYVQSVITNYMKKLLSMGVDGFRLDAAKHIWASDLQTMLNTVKVSYPTTKAGENIWFTQEVIPDGTVTRSDYFPVGTLNEFQFTYAMRDIFRGNNGLSLSSIPTVMGSWGSWGGTWGFIQPQYATIFVNNWDTERNGGSLSAHSDTSGTKRYDLANIFMLAQGYGEAQVQSGFVWSTTNDDAPTASPYDASGNALINVSWDFIHRWADISNMVKFRSATNGLAQTNWQTGSSNQVAFSRGSVGFVALNNDTSAWTKTFATGLPAGTYCNVVHGLLATGGTSCTSDSVTVDSSGNATITVIANGGSLAPAVAIYTGQKVGGDTQAPTVPGAPAAGTVTSTTVALTWTASTDNVAVTGYKVYRNGSQVGTSTTASYTDSGLTANTAYSYTVSAYDAAGNNSAQGTATSVTTKAADIIAPTAPTNLAASNLTSTCVTLTWTASTDNSGTIASYDIYRNGVKIGTSTTPTYTDCGIVASTTYTYTIYAYDPSGNKSVASTALSVTTPIGNTATVYYKVPSGWSAVDIHYGINGTWTTAPGVAMSAACTGWDVYTANLGTATSFAVTFNNGSGTWDNNGGNNYTLGTGISAVSGGVVTKGVNPCTDAPTAPTALTAGTVTASSAAFSWTAATDVFGVTGYKVYRNGTLLGTTTATSYTDATVAASTTYSYTVVAYNAVGNTSAASSALSVTTPGGGSCTSVNVTFTIANAATVVGQNLYVVGNQTKLGNWTPASGYALAIVGSGANVPWTGTVALPPSTAVQYKYVKWNGTTAVWESNQSTTSGNREITTPACGSSLNQNDGSFKK